MACGICSGLLNPCPVCHSYAAPKEPHASWEERLNGRRFKGTHETAFIPTGASPNDDNPPPAAAYLYSIDNGGDRVGPKYSRDFNNEYDGPSKGTW